jgi:hypothetical protein
VLLRIPFDFSAISILLGIEFLSLMKHRYVWTVYTGAAAKKKKTLAHLAICAFPICAYITATTKEYLFKIMM